MYKYETHCHTAPVSKCGKASVKDTVSFYKQLGYDGIFITNHFLDGNINPEARALLIGIRSIITFPIMKKPSVPVQRSE